jgi:DNA-binding CsgD family transcriptional regulator
MKRTSARQPLRQLCGVGLPPGILLASCLPFLHRVLLSDFAFVALYGPRGQLIDVYADWLPSRDEFATITQNGGGPAGHSLALRGGDISNGVSCEFSAAGAQVSISIFRRYGAPRFTKADADELVSLCRYVAFREREVCRVPNAEFRKTEQTAIVFATTDAEVISATANGRGLLALATGIPLVPARLVESASMERALLRRVWQLDSIPHDEPMSRITCATFWGRFVLSAMSILDGPTSHAPVIAIQIRRKKTTVSQLISNIDRLSLSPQQAEIALAIATGQRNHELASSLRISQNTVAFHLKRLYTRLGVHDRSELLSKVQAEARSPEWSHAQHDQSA